MKKARKFEFPEDLFKIYQRAIRLEWWTIAYHTSTVILLYITMGNSQAMKTVWLDDMLSLVPPIAFLISSKIYFRKPDKEHPYGFHRVTTISFLTGSIALTTLGLYLIIDSSIKLISMEHPAIGSVRIFGANIWQGYLMLLALAWSAVFTIILGRIKLPIAHKVHDKVLYNDAMMNKADWMTAAAGMAGVIGIGFGLWWADSVAAIIISLDIFHDGLKNLRAAITDLMDRIPKTIDTNRTEIEYFELKDLFSKMPWIKEFDVRLREEGHVFFGEVFIVPKDDTEDLTGKINDARKQAYDLSWRIHDLVIMPVSKLEEENI